MAKKPPKDPGDYAVGHGRPPKHTRFKPGQSGNPTGRKKGSSSISSIVRRVIETEITLKDNGTQRRVSLVEGVIMRVAQEAIRGNLRAADTILTLSHQHLPAEDGETAVDLPEEDEDILARFFPKQAKRRGTEHG